MSDLSDRVLRDPYPPDVFTPLTATEMNLLMHALNASGVREAGARLHAQWARHLADTFDTYEAAS